MTDNPFPEEVNEPENLGFIFIILPGPIHPEEREAKFGDPLDSDLRVAGLGFVSGGGSLLSAPDENGESSIIYAAVDVDTIDIETARGLLRDNLPDLGCPEGTRIQFGDLQDRFEDGEWSINETRNEPPR